MNKVPLLIEKGHRLQGIREKTRLLFKGTVLYILLTTFGPMKGTLPGPGMLGFIKDVAVVLNGGSDKRDGRWDRGPLSVTPAPAEQL
jgi:hypothetical protein